MTSFRQEVIVINERLSIWIAEFQAMLYMVHTPCGETGQWVHHEHATWQCLHCNTYAPMVGVSAKDQTCSAENGEAAVLEWVSKVTGIEPERLRVSIRD